MTKSGHYPFFNVMNEQDQWDDHTQSIVQSRLQTLLPLGFLTDEEAGALLAISSLLTDDSRSHIQRFVLLHIDQSLTRSMGESQRKSGVPVAKKLIREGLKVIEQYSRNVYSNPYQQLDRSVQRLILENISQAKVKMETDFPQEAFFEKLLNLVIEAYCSHPDIWSEIGYAGPAYPRGYVRADIGQTDPWEAESNP